LDDTDRRLNILFDQLNNDSIPKGIVDQLSNISRGKSWLTAGRSQLISAISAGDSNGALTMHVDLITNATGDMTAWVPGVKQLIRLGV